MTMAPVRLREMKGRRALLVDDAGYFAQCSQDVVQRWADRKLSATDVAAFNRVGILTADQDLLGRAAHLRGVADRIAQPTALDYLILVPTLRCNLACSYCQVSRAAEGAQGYDWDEDTLAAVLRTLDRLDTPRVKIEFQGGEPTLRPDLIMAVIDRCQRFEHAEFVICTNLQRVDDNVMAIFERPDVFISTSLDGDALTHTRNRTGTSSGTNDFFGNLRAVVSRYGPRKISALPTINPHSPPEVDALIDAYAGFGLESIFLRPINFQGFARKRHSDSREQDNQWRDYYERFVWRLIERNWNDRSVVLEETYLSIILRRIFRPNEERHVDLRNPNPMGVDYVVIDYDGTAYPTDEARMLSRSGVVDLAIGDIHSGWETETRDLLNASATNQFDPACQRCAYQPFCGRDVIDDLARYGRIDLPRRDTEFCRRHTHMFDFAFDLIYSDDEAVAYSLSRWLRLPGTPAAFGSRVQ